MVTLSLLIGSNTFAQKSVISNFDLIEGHLSDLEKERLRDSDLLFERTDSLLNLIRDQEDYLAPLFAKKEKKGEKKATKAKSFRIQQGIVFENAYSIIYKTLYSHVKDLPFPYDDYEQRAMVKLNEADVNFSSGKAVFRDYKDMTNKQLKKSVVYKTLKKDLSASTQYEIDGIESVIEAFQIYLDQDEKKRGEELEKRIWNNANKRNTINSYSLYLTEYPSGNWVAEAQSKKTALQENEKKQAASVKIHYTVQLVAVKKQLSAKKLKRLYNKPQNVRELKGDDGLFKYQTGHFKKYANAEAFRVKTGIKDAFVIPFKNGDRVTIKAARTLE